MDNQSNDTPADPLMAPDQPAAPPPSAAQPAEPVLTPPPAVPQPAAAPAQAPAEAAPEAPSTAQPAPAKPTVPADPVPAQPQEPTPLPSEPSPAPSQPAEPPATPTPPSEPAAAPASPTPEPITPSPAAPGPVATPAAAPTEFKPPSHPSRLLLVEDDDALANVYITRLQTEGFDVRRCANGEEALSAALSYKPDLIILDVMMPKVSGFDVLDILRNTPETANVKIVMLTALSQESDKARAESLGVDDYLVKSQVVIADVIDRIRHHLGQQ